MKRKRNPIFYNDDVVVIVNPANSFAIAGGIGIVQDPIWFKTKKFNLIEVTTLTNYKTITEQFFEPSCLYKIGEL